MKKTVFAVLAAALFGWQMSASADPLMQYSNLDLGYQLTDRDIGDNLNGLNLQGSYEFMPNFFAVLGYDYDARGSLSVDTFKYGAGAYYAVNKDLHAVFNIGGLRTHVSDGFTSNSDWFYMGPQLRYRLMKDLELNGGYTYFRVEGVDKNNLDIGALYAINDNLALTAGITFIDIDAANRYGVGIRYAF